MLRGKVVTVFALCLAALASGMPQNQAVDGQQSSTSPPLIQFTDGGIRVNFAGFHAQAGLGGLLTGSTAGGGLHASAGTPWGANAAAGLGGALDGNNPTAIPSVEWKGRFVDREEPDGGEDGKAIEFVTVQNIKTPDAVPAIATGKASVSGTNTVQANAALLDPQAALSEVAEKVKTISKAVSIEPAPIVPALPDQVKDVPAVFTKEVTVLHPKRLFRKRLWGPRKQIIYNIPAEVQEPEAAHSQSIARRQIQGSLFGAYVPGTRQQDQKPDQNTGFYDDIFNIPVSTLNAVNRLLNNNAG